MDWIILSQFINDKLASVNAQVAILAVRSGETAKGMTIKLLAEWESTRHNHRYEQSISAHQREAEFIKRICSHFRAPFGRNRQGIDL
jgi:hypothetical protein